MVQLSNFQRPVAASDEAVQLSVLVPVYNEAENLPELAERLTQALDDLRLGWEVVFANDGSVDGSGALLDHLAGEEPRFKIVHLRRNFGQTAALMAAVDFSRGDIIVMLDADLQNDPADIGGMLQKLDDGYDVVSGWRIDRRDGEWGRRWPSRLANRLISRLSGVHLHDYGCTLKAYRRWTIENIRLYGEMHRYIPIYASWQGARLLELPVAHHPRKHGKSKYGLSRASRVLLDLLVIYFLDRAIDRPMQFFGKAGLASLVGAFVVGCWALWLRFAEGISFIQTPLPLLVSLLAITALLCFCLGIIAEMLMRTYFETRDKRAYLVGKTVNLE
jgi:glycosyltransferase involved in cell wall biosynthesis